MIKNPGIPRARRPGFTLVELLVVILIILMISVATIPSIVSAYNHRQISETARVIQAGLVGARDNAANNGAPAGLRFLADPALSVFDGTNLRMDPSKILACNRFVPIQLAPDYSEGLLRMTSTTINFDSSVVADANLYFHYPNSKSLVPNSSYYPAGTRKLLYVEQEVFDAAGLLNPPTSWFWNIRIGDRLQINNSGIYYTVVGPMQVENPELFVNIGPPGNSPVPLYQTSVLLGNRPAEFLFLVNGVDDDKDGFVDNGWDGVNNDPMMDAVTDRAPDFTIPNEFEWTETESWQKSKAGLAPGQLPYSITRRPVITPGSKETVLPSGVVLDLTSWNASIPERSRLPVDPTSGSVDILLNSDGSVVPSTVYSSPTSFGMSSSFYHFWLAERGDLYDLATPVTGALNYLPQVANANTPAAEPRFLKGDRLLMTLFTRSGQLVTNQIETFDAQDVNLPFVLPQQGVRGDNR